VRHVRLDAVAAQRERELLDLADRIRKRRRASELIEHARQLAAQRVTACVMTKRGAVELSGMTPDQLLDLLDDQDPAS
jgi:hypothetical protein